MSLIDDDTFETADTTDFIGGPMIRRGGKGLNARYLIPHFARARTLAIACFGGGSEFWALPDGEYPRVAINDLDDDVADFFTALRDHPDELRRVCEATPYSLVEFRRSNIRVPTDNIIERARKMWIRSRQGFAGSSSSWGRSPGSAHGWGPTCTDSKLSGLPAFATRLRRAAIDNNDAEAFIESWGQAMTFLYCDFPYPHETRKTTNDYRHEMTTDDHRRMASANHRAVERGCLVAVSSYPCELYSELYAGWRSVEVDVPLMGARHTKGQRRTELMLMSYPVEMERGYVAPVNDGPLFGGV